MTHTLISPVVLMLSAAPAIEPDRAAETAPPPVAGGEGATVYHRTMDIAASTSSIAKLVTRPSRRCYCFTVFPRRRTCAET